MQNLDQLFGPNWPTVLFTNLFSIGFAILLIKLCFKFGANDDEKYTNLLVTAIGALAGWGLGMFFAPYTGQEQGIFVEISKLASAFVSGYALSKFDRFLESTLFSGAAASPTAWIRTGLFSGAFLIALLTVFSNRLYFRANAGEQSLALSKFDATTSTVEVIAKGGKPPYKVEAIYGKDKVKKPTQEIASAGGSTKISFDKTKDWPLPLFISVKDSEGNSEERSVQIDESLLTRAGFKNPQGQ